MSPEIVTENSSLSAGHQGLRSAPFHFPRKLQALWLSHYFPSHLESHDTSTV